MIGGATLLIAGAIVALVVLVPGHGGKTVEHPQPLAILHPDAFSGKPVPFAPAEQRVVEATRQLPEEFLSSLESRSTGKAYALLAPNLRARYSSSDLPWHVDTPSGVGETTSFAGASVVGYIVDYGYASTHRDHTLYAIRLRKTNGAWLIDYVGHTRETPILQPYNYAPSGFLPGVAKTGFGAFAPLIGALIALVAIGVAFERVMSRQGRRNTPVL